MTLITEKSIGLDGNTFAERREELRRKALLPARLVFNDGRSTLSGTIRNLSGSGARIGFCDFCAMPARFMLQLGREPRLRPAVIRWRTLTEIGVTFL